MGVPCAVGMLVAVIAALTLGPAVITVASRFGLLRTQTRDADPAAGAGSAPWWCGGPGPILVATIALALIGLLTLPGYKTNYDDRHYLPDDIPANVGYAAADRHFSPARMNPELLMVESDHDLRNSGGLPGHRQDRQGASSRCPASPGSRRSPGREGTPIEHTTIPFHAQHAGHHPAA